MKEKYRSQLAKDITVGLITTIYMLWMIYASGLSYILLTIMALVPGTIMYIYVRHHQRKRVFTNYEYVILAIFLLLFFYGIVKLPVILQA